MTQKILGISGSLRKDSDNSKLVREAARLFGDAELTEADLNLPLYDGDVEAESGVPANVQALADQIAAANAIVISTPEYNAGISGVLKNALDWVSRTDGNPWDGKPVAVMSAAAGRAGGIRAQTMLRSSMTSFNVRFAPASEVAVASSYQEFDENGQLKSEHYQTSLTRLMNALRSEISGH